VGPNYLRELRGPFDEIPMIAVGGVTRANMADYLAAGATGVGVGSSLFGAEALANRDPATIATNVTRFIATWEEWRDQAG
jgi:2-dehydro-3-deoxyphosphogluconate aldolase/(4S)-4-hydroxy-2-oxoglutarate aldolase